MQPLEPRQKVEIPSQPSGVDTGVHFEGRPPPPPVPPSMSSASSMEGRKTEQSVEVPGFGRKGEGKDANYGVQVPEPQVVSSAELPPEAQQLAAGAATHLDARTDEIPPPIAASAELVEEWLRDWYTPVENLSGKIPPEIGESILWRGVAKGKSGGPSTKVEHFHGRVRQVAVEDDGTFVFLD